MKKLTITIGIPAFNEEQNISHLLVSLLEQKITLGVLDKIIVISDGSTDKTVKAIASFNDKRIQVIDRKKRVGLNETQNQIFAKSQSDILILINADVLPLNRILIDEIVRPMRQDEAVGLVGADTVSARPHTIVERILGNSHVFKQFIYRRINNGNNVFLCHGRTRAFRKKLYKKLHWPISVPEDAYSYFFCLQQGMKFAYAKKAKVVFRSPTSLSDHMKQSNRFTVGNRLLEKYFSKKDVRKSFHVPKLLLLKSIFLFLISRPFSLPMYLGITFCNSVASKSMKYSSKYNPSKSTKKVVQFNILMSSIIDRL